MVSLRDEVAVQIPQRHLEGGLFLAFLALIPFFVLEIFIRLDILKWIITISFIFSYAYILAKLYETQMKAGPARAWFRRGLISAWVSVDGEDLVVRTLNKTEAYKPSNIDWTMPRAFTVKEREISFDLVFQSPDDATKFASRMRANMPSIMESTLP